MSKIDKLVAKLLKRPKDFTYAELTMVLNSFGYKETDKGKTSGSRRAFIHEATKHSIRLHKPHQGNELKSYQIDYLMDELKKEGWI